MPSRIFRRGRRLVACLTSIFLALLAGCSGKPAAPIWVGHVATLSGPGMAPGQSAARGIRLAIEEIDKDLSAGVNRPFKAIHADTRGRLDAFESEAVRLSTLNHVAFLLGGATPDEVERLDRSRAQPVLSPLGSTSRVLGENVFLTGISLDERIGALTKFAVQELKADSVAVVEDTRHDEATGFSARFEKIFRQTWATADAKVKPEVRTFQVPGDGKFSNWKSFYQSSGLTPDRDVVIYAGNAADVASLDPVPGKILLVWDDGFDESPRWPPKTQCTAYKLSSYHKQAAPSFAERYKQAFQKDADEHAAIAYEDMKLLYDAVVRSKDDLRLEVIREHLGKIQDFVGVVGPISMTASRQVRRPVLVVEAWPVAGRYLKRYPAQD